MHFFVALFFCLFAVFPVRASVFQADTFVLKNGMQVVVFENHRSPIVTHMVWYKTGGIDDPLGKAGVAHLLEHLMFKGTKKVPNGEFSRIIARHGGVENAFTSRDYTAYYQNISKSYLELVMFLESDRMQNLTLSKADFLPELEVVKEERLMRVENSPYGLLSERSAKALWGEHPYSRPVIGTAKEIASLTLPDVEKYYAKNYSPDNAILVVAGDVTSLEVKDLAEKYYGKVPSNRRSYSEKKSKLPYPVSSKIKMNHAQIQTHSLQRTYIVPAYTTDDKKQAFAFAVLDEVLGAYQSGQLYRYFVLNKKKARSVSSSYNGFALDKGSFSFSLLAQENGDLETLDKELDVFLSNLKIRKSDVVKAKKRLVVGMEYLKDNPEEFANVIGMFYALGLTVDDLNGWTTFISEVTFNDVQNAYEALLKTPSVTTLLMPEEK